ncbi:hypothetical protein [Bacillus sp. FSL K6-0067]|uniref:hypothetical protein n=1 Tax=Bacillus sp. FSL K6-0067 TaxID=2921412 RepID=UPI0030F7313E
MNFSIQEELQPFAEELQRYITPGFLEELAREIKFIGSGAKRFEELQVISKPWTY